MIYNSFFGFNEEPFGVTPDPRFLYMSKHHEEAIAHLMFGIKQHRGFVMLTGEIGSGKTTIIRHLLGTLNESAHTSMILNPKVEPIDLLKLITQDFGIREKGSTYKDLMDSLNSFLIKCFERDEKAVIVIDEAQEMSTECLEFLRLLSNFETDTQKLLQVILIGQPELKNIISKQLGQRLAVRYHLEPLDEPDTSRYIRHRLKIAGSETITFPAKGAKAIYKASRGIPRLINLYCDRTLMLAYGEGKTRITANTIKKALKEVQGKDRPSLSLKPILVAVMLFLIVFFAAFKIISREPIFWNIGQDKNVKETASIEIANAVPVKAETANTISPTGISMIDGIYKTTNPELLDKASILNLLDIWGEKDLKTETPMKDIEKRGYSRYEFEDIGKIMKFQMPVILTLKEGQTEKSVVLRWLVGDNSLIIDPLEGKKILPFSELKDKIIRIKLLYKNKHNSGTKGDPEKEIMLSRDKATPKLTL